MNGPATVYRAFDAEGALLYVGASTRLGARLDSHRYGKTWWREVARIELAHFPDSATALAAEREAIRTERPAHNVATVSAAEMTQPLQAIAWGREILRLRQNLGLTQADLADRIVRLADDPAITIDRASVARWESGRRKVALRYRPHVAAALEVDATLLFQEAPAGYVA